MKIQSKTRNFIVGGLALLAVLFVARAAVPPAAVSAGQKALPFEAKTTAGFPVKFPDTYKGKIVLLDFWATWCPPCVAEVPNIVAVHEKYHSQGFEILGVSLDHADAGATVTSFTTQHKMAWPQIYDGNYWDAAIAKQYNIKSIPHAFLVNGDTGEIIADGDSLRGKRLEPAIKKALATKAK